MTHPATRRQGGDNTCTLLAFPLHRRVGKVRDVAGKMLAKTTDRHAQFYRDQVTSALLNHLERLGVPRCEQEGQTSAFWNAVQAEMIGQTHRGQRPGGSAA